MGLFSCQNSHWLTVAILQKATVKEEGLWNITYISLNSYFCAWYLNSYL